MAERTRRPTRQPNRRPSARRYAVVLTLVAALVAGACSAGPEPEPVAERTVSAAPTPSGTLTPEPPRRQALAGTRPNVVMVLMDDFSMDLLPTMAAARRLARRGATFDHFVVDSLCCVSRASLMTGQFPHQTGVLTNSARSAPGAGPAGGWAAYRDYGNDARTVSLRLQKAGYTTGFVGKYLNEYEYNPGWKVPPVPPGWDQFNVLFGSAYDGWGFDSLDVVDGQVVVRNHPLPPASAPAAEKDAVYAGQVIEDYALDFIAERSGDDDPWFLQVNPFAPHNRVNAEGAWPGEPVFPAAFRDRPGGTKRGGNCGRVRCADLTVADLPGYGDDSRDNTPVRADGRRTRAWNDRAPMRRGVAEQRLRDRARMVQSVDRTLARIMKAVDDDTVVVLTSDNGFHLGQNGLWAGKGTAYDTDLRVPLLMAGPGIEPGPRAEWTSNIDLAPTLEDWAGIRSPRHRAGTSLLPALEDPELAARDHVFVDHTTDTVGDDPDLAFTGGELQRIPTYLAVRSRTGLLIRNDLDPRAAGRQVGWEFYSYADHPWERRNAYAAPRHAAEVAALQRRLEAFDDCRSIIRNQRWPKRCRDLTGPQ
ncbi:sulfatase-like hydrolase/transferase [Nocardioides sp. Y6]|uniref:Sulfatase-like hydrolase/transferase n=1 Tax=Nocardioides malaquae TaxID=2773426 RepID=A0ABR9RX85_9ACTN|nr:sulfatase-like hydrolase/transferase [Nocardioides malaquae]MBE7325985.1 sulfatase-like hydrolase/transferase [Nocardioides malaquae]